MLLNKPWIKILDKSPRCLLQKPEKGNENKQAEEQKKKIKEQKGMWWKTEK